MLFRGNKDPWHVCCQGCLHTGEQVGGGHAVKGRPGDSSEGVGRWATPVLQTGESSEASEAPGSRVVQCYGCGLPACMYSWRPEEGAKAPEAGVTHVWF